VQNHRRDSAGKYRRQILSTRDRAAPWSMFAEPSGLTGECTSERYRPWSPEWTFQVHGGHLLVFHVYDRNSWYRVRPAVASCRVLSSCLVVQKVFASHVHRGRRQSRNHEPSALADPVQSTPPSHKDTCTLLTIWSSSPHLARGAPICVGVSALENSFPDLLAQ
jgi:hypothetical protein